MSAPLSSNVLTDTQEMVVREIRWTEGWTWVEDFWGPVSCPSCLLLMREAIGPVRWDFLEEKGLAPKLEAR